MIPDTQCNFIACNTSDCFLEALVVPGTAPLSTPRSFHAGHTDSHQQVLQLHRLQTTGGYLLIHMIHAVKCIKDIEKLFEVAVCRCSML